MKIISAVCLILWTGVFSAVFAQDTTAQVLSKLDEKAKVFTSLEATLTNAQVVADTKATPQSGKLYIKMDKASSTPRLLWDITEPKNDQTAYLIDKGGLVAFNRSKKTVTRKPVGSNSDMLQLLVMGFGVSSSTLTKNYKAEAKPRVAVNGVQTVPLELQSITEATAKFPRITLYLDPQTWTPVRTRVVEKGAIAGDYVDFGYSNTKLNKGVADSVFKLKLPNNSK
jgi:outer membrane lipoprotein-sorting protein